MPKNYKQIAFELDGKGSKRTEIIRTARALGELSKHSSGLDVNVWHGNSYTMQDMLEDYGDGGTYSDAVLDAIENQQAEKDKLRIRIQEIAMGSHFPGWKPEQIGWDSIPEDDNDYSKYNGEKPL